MRTDKTMAAIRDCQRRLNGWVDDLLDGCETDFDPVDMPAVDTALELVKELHALALIRAHNVVVTLKGAAGAEDMPT